MKHADQMTKAMQECVDACMACHSRCEEAMSYCLQQGGRHTEAPLMRAMMDCSDIARACADMMMRRSSMSAEMCAMCARICDMCAEACMGVSGDAELMRCAQACRRCAEMCRAMAGAAA